VGVPFFVTLSVLALAGLWYLAVPMAPYAYYPLSFTRDRGGWFLVGGGLLAALAARAALNWDVLARLVRRTVPAGLSALLVALAIYAYFFRQEGGTTAAHDAMAFRTFAWYLTPWVLALAVAATGLVTTTHFWRSPVFFLTFAVFSLFFFYKTRIVPEHFWAARRFLAMSMPGALLLVAALLDQMVRGLIARLTRARTSERTTVDAPQAWPSVAGTLIVVLLAVPIAIVFWRQSSPIRHHVEYAGVIPKLEALAGRFGDRDLVLVESRNAGSDLHTLALPLTYIYARNVLVLASVIPPKRMLEDFVAWADAQYANVYFLGGAGTDLLTQRIAAEPLTNDRFQVLEYDSPNKAYPTGPRRKEFEYGLYRLSPAIEARSGPIDLKIGELDDLNVVRFFARERHADGTVFRWTRDQSSVLLLGIAPDARRITIWMGHGGRPKQTQPPVVEFAIGDRVLGTATATDDVRPHTFDLPADVAAQASVSDDPVRLQLRVSTWTPASMVGGRDTRELGVIVTRVEVR
jgi:hypothetical protein